LKRETKIAGCDDRVRTSFAKQGLMSTLGATLTNVAPGVVQIAIRPIQRSRSSTALFMQEQSALLPTRLQDMPLLA